MSFLEDAILLFLQGKKRKPVFSFTLLRVSSFEGTCCLPYLQRNQRTNLFFVGGGGSLQKRHPFALAQMVVTRE